MKAPFIFILLFAQTFVFAQNNAVATGGTATGTGGSATFSIGQVHYKSTSNSSATIAEGLQQAFEIVTLSTNNIPQIQLKASVYPNPTVQNVTLSITDFDLTDLQFTLFDITGKIISIGKVTQTETQIEMRQLSQANYFLKITKNNQDLKTFKIIKNN